MDQLVVHVTSRAVGKRSSRRLRRQGWIPGVVYGKDMETFPVAIQEREMTRLIAQGALRGRLIELRLEGDGDQNGVVALVQEIQRHPITGAIIHVDFHRVSMEEEVEIDVPVVVTGEDQLQHDWAIIQHQLRSVTVRCRAAEVPDHLEADVSGLEFGDQLTVAELKVPEGVRVMTDPHEVVLTVVSGRSVTPEEAPEEDQPAEKAPPSTP